MRKLFCLLAVSMMLTGCGANTTNEGTNQVTNNTNSSQATDNTTQATDNTTNNETSNNSEDGMIDGKYKVEFGTAEKVQSQYGDGELLMVSYTFTNNSDETVSPDIALMLQAFQDGIEIEQTFETALTGDNASKSIRPGASLECKALFKITSTSDVEVEATAAFSFDGDMVTKTYTLQ